MKRNTMYSVRLEGSLIAWNLTGRQANVVVDVMRRYGTVQVKRVTAGDAKIYRTLYPAIGAA